MYWLDFFGCGDVGNYGKGNLVLIEESRPMADSLHDDNSEAGEEAVRIYGESKPG